MWPASTQLGFRREQLRPVVRGPGVASQNSAGVLLDTATTPTTYVLWANPADHTQPFSTDILTDGLNLFGAIQGVGAGFTSGNGVQIFTGSMNLVDASSSVIGGAPVYQSTFTVTISNYISPISFTRTVQTVVTPSSGIITRFNGIQMTISGALVPPFTDYGVNFTLFWLGGSINYVYA